MSTSLSRLLTYYSDYEAEPLLRAMIRREFKGKIALISSFGADSVALIAMVAKIDPNVPVLFLDTGKHFKETLDYVDEVEERLGLTDLRRLQPRQDLINSIDPGGTLWKTQVNRCCWMRKVEPLNRALETGEFEAVITGRKHYQTEQRQTMENIELFNDGIFRVNPLLNWNKSLIQQRMEAENLPQHPLVEKGYPSIGCEPCTRMVRPGEDERSGRWAHTIEMSDAQKQECGIHIQGSTVNETDWSV